MNSLSGKVAALGSYVALGLFALVGAAGPAAALDEFRFGTSWAADGERGGYYHGIANGIYEKHGLKVTIVPGGPQINNPQLLIAGKLDGVMLGSMIESFNYAKQAIPTVTVAAIYQKHPQVLVAHAAKGYKSLADLKGKPIMISSLARNGYWMWLKAKFGYTDDQIRPYTFNLGPFLSNQDAIQQGYITWDPLALKQEGANPAVFLMADEGYEDYTALIAVMRETLKTRRDVVQRFLNATIESWYGFLYGDPSKTIELIRRINPTVTDELILNSRKALKDYGIVDSGDAEKLGIGAMTEARWHGWFLELTKAGVFDGGDYWKSAFDVSLVNKKVGMELKK